MMYLKFPLQVGPDGLPARASYADHVLQMIEELLFTNPGERLNRPRFGVGLLQLVFGPNDEEIATATQFLIQNELQTWLSEHIQVTSVQATNIESSLEITIEYTLVKTGQSQRATFVR
ncbi:MAG: GPW/gp25 family protein [Myxococcota bacterium]